MKTDIVVTTVFEPEWLQGYLNNIEAHGWSQDVTIRIICDKKTPASVRHAAANAVKQGYRVDCPELEEQVAYLAKLGLDESFIPWNTDNRRNIGFLKAIESGCDYLISIDDDNLCPLPGEEDFVSTHLKVLKGQINKESHRLAHGKSWFNICELLESQVRDPIFARGYPYSARGPGEAAGLSEISRESDIPETIAINAGLWLDEPDVDAISRIAQRPKIQSATGTNVVLAPETWSPINTQNTALIQAALPAYYYIKMGFPLGGMSIDRFGDILSGYFIQKCAKHLGHGICFGAPVAQHARSPHNLFKDLYHELAGIVIIEELLPWLQEVKIEGDSYKEAYASLADAILQKSDEFKGFVWDSGGREFLNETGGLMNRWLETLDILGV